MNNIPDLKVSIGSCYHPAAGNGRDRFPVFIDRILVPTDLTPSSERAVEYGFVLARRFGAHLTLLHVYKEPYGIEFTRGPHVYEAVLAERMHFKKMLEAIGEEVKDHHPDCDTEFREGVACQEIVNTAKERNSDLIIISTHHYNWLKRLAYGCDAEEILRRAPCPILVLMENHTSVEGSD
jgi:nucleotide-binding universal stress UspA family protein